MDRREGMKHSQQRGLIVRIKRCTVRKECFESALIPRGIASRSCELFYYPVDGMEGASFHSAVAQYTLKYYDTCLTCHEISVYWQMVSLLVLWHIGTSFP